MLSEHLFGEKEDNHEKSGLSAYSRRLKPGASQIQSSSSHGSTATLGRTNCMK
jgi:hypothetical protein